MASLQTGIGHMHTVTHRLAGIALVLLNVLPALAADRQDVLTQISVFSALLNGQYDGTITCSELRRYGNLGIGCFQALDGELAMLDGQVYRIRADGRVSRAADADQVPFAAITPFEADITFSAGPIDDRALLALIESRLPSANLFYALRVDGVFDRIRTRSVPRQNKPYPRLVDVVKNQPIFTNTAVSGSLIGFWCPAYVGCLGVPGFHLHFLDDARTCGGHVLDFKLREGRVLIDTTTALELRLPEHSEFREAQLGGDHEAEIRAVEQDPADAAAPAPPKNPNPKK